VPLRVTSTRFPLQVNRLGRGQGEISGAVAFLAAQIDAVRASGEEAGGFGSSLKCGRISALGLAGQ